MDLQILPPSGIWKGVYFWTEVSLGWSENRDPLPYFWEGGLGLFLFLLPHPILDE